MSDEKSGDEQLAGFVREEVRTLALFRDAMISEGFSREEAMRLLVAFGISTSEAVKSRRFNPPVQSHPASYPVHSSHILASYPDTSSMVCSECGISSYNPLISIACDHEKPDKDEDPAPEQPGTDETPDPPEPEIQDELEHQAMNHANETGHGVDNGS